MSSSDEPGGTDGLLRLDVQRSAEGLVLTVSGELDISNCSRLRCALDELGREQAPCIVVDLSALSFTDSSGLAVLVRAYKQARRSGTSFAIVCPKGGVRKLFQITGLVDVLHVVGTLEEARTPLSEVS